MPRAKTLHASKVSAQFRISLSKEVAERLKVEIGDMVIIVDDGRGNLILKKAE